MRGPTCVCAAVPLCVSGYCVVVYLRSCMPVCPRARLCPRLRACVCLSAYICISLCMSAHVRVCLSVRASVHPSRNLPCRIEGLVLGEGQGRLTCQASQGSLPRQAPAWSQIARRGGENASLAHARVARAHAVYVPVQVPVPVHALGTVCERTAFTLFAINIPPGTYGMDTDGVLR